MSGKGDWIGPDATQTSPLGDKRRFSLPEALVSMVRFGGVGGFFSYPSVQVRKCRPACQGPQTLTRRSNTSSGASCAIKQIPNPPELLVSRDGNRTSIPRLWSLRDRALDKRLRSSRPSLKRAQGSLRVEGCKKSCESFGSFGGTPLGVRCSWFLEARGPERQKLGVLAKAR